MKDLTSKEIQNGCRERPGTFKRFLAGSFVAAALLSSPLLERTAMAQPVPEAQNQGQVAQRRNVRYDVTGSSQVSLSSGTDQIQAYIVMTDASVPTVAFEGPAVVNLRFYPTVRPADVANGSLALSVRYSVDNGAPVEERFTTNSSSVTHPTLTQNGLAIGTPKDFSVTVSGEGRHSVSVGYPNGFVVIQAVQAPEVAPVQPPPRPLTPPPVQQPAQNTPGHDAAPEAPPRPMDGVRSRASLEYSGVWLKRLGNAGNGGMLHQLDALYRHPFGEHAALLVGPRLSLFDSGISPSGASTGVLMGDASAMLGVALYFGDVSLYAAGFGGLQVNHYGVTAADGRSASDTGFNVAYGGRLGFDYRDIIGLSADMSNSPFNPGLAHLRISLPWTWARDARPTLDANLLWLHVMRPAGPDGLGGASLDESNLYLRALVQLPVWRLGPVVPWVLAGAEYDRSLNGAGPADQANALLGGALSVDIADSVRLQAGAGASVPNGAPFVLFSASLR